MKLNKGVCIKCCEKTPNRIWGKEEDAYWDKNKVLCSCGFILSSGDMSKIPKHCPYELEHVVNNSR